MKMVYVASPLHANTIEEMEQNRQKAQEYCEEAMSFGRKIGEMIIPISPISNFSYLDENNPKERAYALNMGLALLSKCSELWVAGDRISEGMKNELNAAARMDIPVFSMKIESEKIQAVIEEPQPLLTASNCISGSKSFNYENQLLILKPKSLSAWCRQPENQLWIATHGNGTNPDAIGRSVFVKNLMDNGTDRWDRSDFLGVADPSKLPSWATEKLDALQNKNLDMEDER